MKYKFWDGYAREMLVGCIIPFLEQQNDWYKANGLVPTIDLLLEDLKETPAERDEGKPDDKDYLGINI